MDGKDATRIKEDIILDKEQMDEVSSKNPTNLLSDNQMDERFISLKNKINSRNHGSFRNRMDEIENPGSSQDPLIEISIENQYNLLSDNQIEEEYQKLKKKFYNRNKGSFKNDMDVIAKDHNNESGLSTKDQINEISENLHDASDENLTNDGASNNLMEKNENPKEGPYRLEEISKKQNDKRSGSKNFKRSHWLFCKSSQSSYRH